MKNKIIALLCCSATLSVLLTGCGSANYADGTYEGKSQVHEGDEEGNGGGYGVVTLTIKDNTITACEYRTYETDGTLKGDDYGKQNGEIANKDYYAKAQKAVKANAVYAENLVEKQLDDVDAISGATISYNEFREAVLDALEQAKQ